MLGFPIDKLKLYQLYMFFSAVNIPYFRSAQFYRNTFEIYGINSVGKCDSPDNGQNEFRSPVDRQWFLVLWQMVTVSFSLGWQLETTKGNPTKVHKRDKVPNIHQWFKNGYKYGFRCSAPSVEPSETKCHQWRCIRHFIIRFKHVFEILEMW